MNALKYGQRITWHTGEVSTGQMVRSRTIKGKEHYYAFSVDFGHVLVFLADKKKRMWMVQTDSVGNPNKLPEIS